MTDREYWSAVKICVARDGRLSADDAAELVADPAADVEIAIGYQRQTAPRLIAQQVLLVARSA